MSGSKTSIKQVDPMAYGTRKLYNQLTSVLQPIQEYIPLLDRYQGSIVPGMTGLQQQAFGGAEGLTPLAKQFQDVSSGLLNQAGLQEIPQYGQMAQRGIQDMLAPADIKASMTAMEPMRQYGMDVFKEDIVPYIMEKYGPSMGASQSGAMYQQLGREGARLSNQLGAQMGQNALNLYQQKMGMLPSGVNLAMQGQQMPGQIASQALGTAGMGTGLLGDIAGLGAQQRGIQGEILQEPYMKWQYPFSQGQLDLLRVGLNQPGTQPVVQPGTQSFGSSFGQGIMGGAGEAVGSAASAYLLKAMGFMSDKRYKENIKPINNALEKLEKIEGVTFRYKENQEHSAGVIAQQVEEVLPEAVIEKDGIKYVKYDAIVGLLVSAIKELAAKEVA